jgi:hypothetical protein
MGATFSHKVFSYESSLFLPLLQKVSEPEPSMERGNGDRREPRGEVKNGETNGNRFLEALDRF